MQLQHIFKIGKTATLIAICATLTVTSCKKKTDTTDDGTKFQGTWTGTNSCSGGSTTLNISAGSDINNLVVSTNIGATGCTVPATLTLIAGGSTLSISPLTINDNCSHPYQITGSGHLDSTTLTFTEIITTGGTTATCTFKGHK